MIWDVKYSCDVVAVEGVHCIQAID